MRVVVGAFNRASTGAISLGMPMIPIGWAARSCAACAACREGAAQSNSTTIILSKFVVRKVGGIIPHFGKAPLLSQGGGAAPNKQMQRHLRTRRGGGGWFHIR